jgi:hypothetical protein
MQAGTRSKRCRENRPLAGVGRLGARERPGMEMLINAEPVALGAESFPTPAKGGIARAPAC